MFSQGGPGLDRVLNHGYTRVKVERPCDVPEEGLITDCLWADYDEELEEGCALGAGCGNTEAWFAFPSLK